MTLEEKVRQYFRSAATDWQIKSVNELGDYSVIEGRSRTVMDVVCRHENAKRFLDIGCGTGQLVIAVAQHGLAAEGIDFAEEMIAQCEANARVAGVSASFRSGS